MSKPYCNVHVHTFNAQYVPDDFIGQFVPAFSKLLTRMMKRKRSARFVIWLLKRLPRKSAMAKYIAFLKVGIKESQYKIFNDLRKQEGYPDGTRFVVLPLNFKYMGAGKVTVPYEQQLNDLIKVAASSGGTLLPFVFVDPRMGTRESNLEFVRYYIKKKGFVGIKMYPALGYYPYDPRLELVYEFAAQHRVPIMTHCSSTGVFYNDRKRIPDEFIHSTSFNKLPNDLINGGPREYDHPFPPPGVKKKLRMQRFADHFLNPVNYTDALEKWKDLKICFAHFGLDNDQYHGHIKLSWHQDVIALMKKYDNVFTDISYSLHFEKVRKQFQGYMKDPKLNKKILYGTDFFMTLQEVDRERDLLEETKTTFGADYEKIARDNMDSYLSSAFYNY